MTTTADGHGGANGSRPLRFAALGLLALAGALHLPFVGWLVLGDSRGPAGDLRSLAALAALILLALVRRPRTGRGAASLSLGVVIGAGLSVVAAVLASVAHGFWIASLAALAFAVALWATPGHSPRLAASRYGVLVLLAASLYPFERDLAALLDPVLQTFTAHCASPLVNLTGLAVVVEAGGAADPMLVGDNLFVTVTALCAGSQTLLALWTLGLIIAEVFLDRWDLRLIFVVLTPVFGFVGNVLRVAVSTHAADRWGNAELTWDIAHDAIGYVAFAATYLLLIVLVRLLRRVRPAPNPVD